MLRPTTRFILLLATLLAALLATTAATASSPRAASAPKSCWAGYSYDGVQSTARGFGVSAVLTMQSRSVVSAGHVAAWVGVGGAGMGPGGSDAWVQAGIAQDVGGSDHLYFEFKRPGDAHATSVTLAEVQTGKSHTITIFERFAQRNAWLVRIDGARVSDPIVLPGSHGAFSPVASAENWDGDAAACNHYSFDFSNLAVATQFGSGWQPFDLSRVLRDPAYLIALRANGFTASAR